MRDNATELQIDPTRIAAYGYSAGAQLALLLGVTQPSDGLEGPVGSSNTDSSVQAVIAGGAPADFQDRSPDSNELAYYLGGTRAEVPDAYQKASPIHWVSPADAPTMFYFGTLDFIVDTSNAVRMHRALIAAGVDTEFHWLNFATHLSAAADRRALEHVANFLAVHLS
jgi:acetyl esterase/lipase